MNRCKKNIKLFKPEEDSYLKKIVKEFKCSNVNQRGAKWKEISKRFNANRGVNDQRTIRQLRDRYNNYLRDQEFRFTISEVLCALKLFDEGQSCKNVSKILGNKSMRKVRSLRDLIRKDNYSEILRTFQSDPKIVENRKLFTLLEIQNGIKEILRRTAPSEINVQNITSENDKNEKPIFSNAQFDSVFSPSDEYDWGLFEDLFS